MQIDIESLETYNRLARDGSQSAAAALSQLIGIETHVEVTNVSLLSPADLRYEFVGREFAGVRVGLEGALSGETVLAFDDRGRETITDVLVGGDDEMAESSIREVGNIMTSGFIDGWADHLNRAIDVMPPEYVQGSGEEFRPDGVAEGDEQVLLFRSRVRTVEDAVDFRICLMPERAALEDAMEPPDGTGIDFEKLEVFNEMTRTGAATAADNITQMTGIETDLEVNRLSFVPVEEVPSAVGDERYVGTVMQYQGGLEGYLVILFDQPSAQAVANSLVPGSADGDSWGKMEQSALEELGNIMTSGFIDGWANVLESEIEHSPPSFVADMGSSIMSPIVGRIAAGQEHAFMLDSTIETDDDRAFRCELYALPNEAELTDALDRLLIERADRTEADPSEVF
jgi:chemotaxis protein CheC